MFSSASLEFQFGFAYDNMGRLIGTTTQYSFLPGSTFTNSYTYDAASNRTSLTAPDGSITTYGYDTLNRLNGLANSWAGSFGFGYDALSRRTSLTRPNGVNTSYSYDSLSRLLSVLHQASGSTIDGASYTYDNAGNRTSKTNDLNGITENYTYDALYELTQVTQGGSTTESYSYDLIGNRLSSLGVPTYNYNSSNELTSSSQGSYTYDANGNTLTDAQGRSFTWDFENRLTQVVVPGTGTVNSRYDPFGRRIQKNGPLGIINYLYDGAYLVEEMDNLGNALARYTQSSHETGGFLEDEPLAQLRSSTTSYYQADALHSITSLTDSEAVSTDTYTYDNFGKQVSFTGTTINSYRYTGREFDPEIGSYEYRARYFDQNAGRFISEDPIGLRGGINFYRYVRNDPANITDPTGLYSLQGFSPQDAALMNWAIGQLVERLRQKPCCIDPKMRDRVLNLLQPGGTGGITFVYRKNLPSPGPHLVNCAQVGLWDFFTSKVEISQAALDGTCPCPLSGTILHEVTHQTWGNFFNTRGQAEPQAYGNAAACFGDLCAMPHPPNP